MSNLKLVMLLMSMVGYALSIERVEKFKEKNYEIRLAYQFNSSAVSFVRCVEFGDFKLLKLHRLKNSTVYKFSEFLLNYVFLPSSRVPLDRSFGDVESFNSQVVSLVFIFINGLDLNRFDLTFTKTNRTKFNVYFYDSNMLPFAEGQKRPEDRCVESDFVRSWYFRGVHNLHFGYGARFAAKICKYLFKNARVHQIFAQELTDTFIKRNLIDFTPLSGVSTLNSSINIMWTFVYDVKINRRLLDSDVLSQMTEFCLKGRPKLIEADVFANFDYIFYVYIRISNLRAIFSQGMGWINSLNGFLSVNMSNETEIVDRLNYSTFVQTYLRSNLEHSRTLERPYMYPDEDFCWFARFPFRQLVFLNPHTVCTGNCSCTLLWLLRYVHLLNRSDDAMANFVRGFKDESNIRFTQHENHCDFARKVHDCEQFKQTTIDQHRSDFFSAMLESEYVDFASVILTPIIGMLGIVANLLNIRTILSINLAKTSEDLQQTTLLRFMLAYSIVNLVYCSIHTMSLMSKCIDPNSVFCSGVYYTKFAQYFKIIIVQFAGSVARNVSNAIYFGISINRYILLEKESKLAVLVNGAVSKMSKKLKAFLIILFTLITITLSSHKLIIYKVIGSNVFNLFYDLYPGLFFSLPVSVTNSRFYEQSEIYDSTGVTRTKSSVYESLTYVNFILNDVLLFLVFTLVDVMLMYAFKKSTDKKKLFLRTNVDEERAKKKLTELEQAVKNVFRVIIVNIALLLAVKSFDLFISISKFNIWSQNLSDVDSDQKLNGFCHLVKICSVYEDLVNVCFMLYFCFSTVSFYYLNRNFRLNFGCCKKRSETISSLVMATLTVKS